MKGSRPRSGTLILVHLRKDSGKEDRGLWRRSGTTREDRRRSRVREIRVSVEEFSDNR